MQSSLALALLAGCCLLAPAAAIDVVPNLNITAYLGRWYQMYEDKFVETTIERGVLCVTGDYK